MELRKSVEIIGCLPASSRALVGGLYWSGMPEEAGGGRKAMNIISLGAGVQSTTMLLMAAHGEITPKPDYAIFADTGWEPKKVYQHLEWLKKEAAKFGIKVIVTQEKNIKDDLLFAINSESKTGKAGFTNLPFHLINKDGTRGMAKRQCTAEYKIRPIQKKIRELLGYKPRQRIKEKVTLWMGISTDEIQRVKPSREKWIEHRWPLIEKRMNRLDCLSWMERKGYPQPPKSSCVGCPFHNDALWLDMKLNDKEAWEEAVEMDRAIKKLHRLKGKPYLHGSCQPLDEVYLHENQITIDLFDNECEGMCGV